MKKSMFLILIMPYWPHPSIQTVSVQPACSAVVFSETKFQTAPSQATYLNVFTSPLYEFPFHNSGKAWQGRVEGHTTSAFQRNVCLRLQFRWREIEEADSFATLYLSTKLEGNISCQICTHHFVITWFNQELAWRPYATTLKRDYYRWTCKKLKYF